MKEKLVKKLDMPSVISSVKRLLISFLLLIIACMKWEDKIGSRLVHVLLKT